MAIADVLSRLDEIEQGEKTQQDAVGLLAQSVPTSPSPAQQQPPRRALSTMEIINAAENIGQQEAVEADNQRQAIDNTGTMTKVADTLRSYAAGSGELLTQAGKAVEMFGRTDAAKSGVTMPEAVAGMDNETSERVSAAASSLKPGESILQPAADALMGAGKTTAEYWDESMSEGGKALSKMAWQDAPGAANKLHAAVLGASRSAPQTIGIGFAGKALTGMLPVAQAIPGVAKGLTRIGLPAPFAQKAAEWMATGAVYGTAEGISAGLSNAAQVGEEIDKMDFTALAKTSPKFNEYLAQLDQSLPAAEREKIAKGMLKEDAENMALWATAALSTATGTIAGAGIFDKVLSSKRFLLDRALGGLKEAHQEFWQSGLGEKLPQNIAMQQADQGIGAMDNVWHEAVAGAGPGAIMGLVAGGGGRGKTDDQVDPTALERNKVAAQIERMNLPTRDLIAIRNGEWDKVPYAPDLLKNSGLTPAHIDGILENRANEMSAARFTLESDINQGPLVRAATMATVAAEDAISRDRARRVQQEKDTTAAIDALVGQYNPSAPAPTERTNRTLWPAVDQAPAIVQDIADRTMQGEWDQQEADTARYLKLKNEKKKPGRVISAEEQAFMRAYEDSDNTPENRAAWPSKTTAEAQGIADRKMQGEWDQQEQNAINYLSGRFSTKPAQEKKADPLAAERERFDESYNAVGTVPESKGNVTDEEAARHEQKVQEYRRQQRNRSLVKAYNDQKKDDEELLNREDVPDDVKRESVRQAQEIVKADPVYQHMAEAKKRGKLNLAAMGQDYDRDTIGMINRRYPAIFSLVGTVKPDDFANEMGYESLDAMVRRFSEARTQKELTAQIAREKMDEWQRADAEQGEFFANKAERTQGREWAGAGRAATRKTGAVFPAPEEAVASMEAMIKSRPDLFTDADLEHWTFTAGQQARLRQAHQDATGAKDFSGPETSDNTKQAQQNEFDVAQDATGKEGAVVDQAATGAALSPDNDIPEPTDAQKEAGNYKKGHARIHGLDIAIENPAGSVRSGTDPDGKRWETPIRDHYGYIKGTVGKDKDHIDMFVPEGFVPADGDMVAVVDQIDPKTGKFDEHKIVMGASNEQSARETYLRNYDHTGESRIGAVTLMSVNEFKGWLDSGNTKKPLGDIRGSQSARNEQQTDLPLTGETQRADQQPTSTQGEPNGEERQGQGRQRLLEEELAATSDDDLTAMLDDVFGEKKKPAEPKAPAKKRLPSSNKQPQQKQPTRTAGQITKEGGIAALDGVKSAMEGLSQLFGGKNRLGSGLAFDEETYAKAKPHFVAAWNDAKQVGYSLKELIKHFHDKFGKAIRPYLERFLSDVKAGDLTVGEKASTVNQADTNQQQPEGGQNDNVSGAGTEENGQSLREDDTATEGTGNRPLDGVAPEVRQGSDQAEPATDGGTGSGNKGKRGNQGTDGNRVSKPRGGRGGNAKVHPASTGTGSDQGDGGSGALTDAPASIPAKNFIITDDVGLGKGGQAQKYRDNIAAIRILKQLRLEQRRATPEEQKALARYVGWGGIPNAFRNAVTGEVKEDWKDRVDELEGLLTKEELDTARNSTQNAHYTAGDIVTSIWKAVRRLGFNGGLVLEPSVGTGNFLGLMPQDVAGNTKFIAAEFDGITAGIAQALYPQEGIFHTPFDKLPLPSGEFDLVIGNPPFGQSSLSFAHLPSINRHSIHNQFFLAGLDALKPGGVQAFVVSRYLMDAKDSSVRREIADQAKLLAAIRLPQTAFKENSLTDVVTDIIFLQKKEAPASAEENKESADGNVQASKPAAGQENVPAVPSWVDTVEVIDKATGEPMTINSYFAQKPSMVMGTIDRSGSMRYEGDITVRYTGDNISRDIDAALNAALPESIMKRNDAVGESEKRFKTMADSLEIALSGAEDGSISIDKKTGKLVMVREMKMEQSGSYMLTRVELSPGVPWSNKLTLQDDGRWLEEVDQVDANGDKVKRIIGGKTSKLNAKELKRYTDKDVPDGYRLGQLEYSRLRDAVSLMDTLKAQINLEMNPQSTDAKIEANRKRLANEYDKFVATHKYHLSSPVISKLIADMPDGALLLSLEASYTKAISTDQAKKLGKEPRKAEAEPSAILSKRVIFPYTAPEKTSNPQDALAITLSEQGKVDMDMLADLLDKTADEVATELHDKLDDPLIYKNPETGQWETADEYLGGNVVQKLHAAKADGLEKNVAALEKIQPAPWGADKVTVMPGATWVPETVYADFITHLTGAPAKVRFGRATNTFAVVRANDSTATAKQWSTEDRGVSRIVEALLNSKTIRITYTDSDGRIHVDQDATELANIKLEEVKAEFSSWVFRDGERRRLLVDLFNKKYNVRVNRQRNGQHLKFPGKVPDHIISLRRHQKNGVWRGIVDRFVLYDHAVGAGKTFTGISRALERKRMGLSRKPMIIVPNHLVEQFAADVYTLYPGAKVLAAGKKDLEKSKRRRVFAKIATGDWDIVIVPHSSFAFIGIDTATETRYLEEELKVAEEAVKEAEAQAEEDGTNEGWRKIKPLSVKQAEALRDKLLERLKKLKNRAPGKDRLLTFEQMGVDDLTVDEAHEFKNLFYSSNMQARGMNPRAGSAKAYDLWLKSRVLRESGGSIAFMTGTPISNSAVEMYGLMRYLAADEIVDMGIDHFDAWRAQFVDATTEYEPTESGRGLKEVNRLGRDWSNMRSLMDLYYSFADCVTNDDIKKWYLEDKGKEFPVPRVKGGGRVGVNVKPTPGQESELQRIVAEFEALPDEKDIKIRNANRLRLMDQARKISLDVRALNPNAPGEPGGKLEQAAKRIHDIYKQWDADKGTQLVFLDRSVPKSRGDQKRLEEYDALLADLKTAERTGDEVAERKAIESLEKFDANEMEELRVAQTSNWNGYQQIKNDLVAMGIPANEIRFVQEANTDEQKQAMFDEVNAGAIRVLIGSTPRMGAGTNVQERLVALHHIDVTWKPSDIEQREGRIIRQKNKLLAKYGMDRFEVEILAYTTESTIDAKLWSLNSTKLRMINGIRQYNGEFNMEFDDEDSVGMAEIAAIASGDPMQLERVKLDGEIKKLERQQSAFRRQQWGVQEELDRAERISSEYPDAIPTREKLSSTITAAIKAQSEEAAQRKIIIDGQVFSYESLLYGADENPYRYVLNKRDQAKQNGEKFSVEIDGETTRSTEKADEKITAALGDEPRKTASHDKLPFDLAINGEHFFSRDGARRKIADLANQAMEGKPGDMGEVKVGTVLVYGIPFSLSVESQDTRDSRGEPVKEIIFYFEHEADAANGGKPVRITSTKQGTVLKINNKVNINSLTDLFSIVGQVEFIPTDTSNMRGRLDETNEALPSLMEKAATVFPKEQELNEKRSRLAEVERELASRKGGSETTEPAQPEAPAQLSKSSTLVPAENRANIEQEITASIGGVRTRRLINSGRVVIVQSVDELPKGAADSPAVKYSKDGAIQGAYVNGTAYLVRDGIEKGQAFPVLLHELGEHAGQLGFNSDAEYQSILKSLENRKDVKGATGDAIRAAMARVPSSTKPEHYWSEVAAYLIENNANEKLSIFDRIMAFFKKLLVKAGLSSPDTLSHKDLVAFARAAVNAASGVSISDQAARFSKAMPQTATEAFKKWFGKSKVTRNGQPHILYHGTQHPQFLKDKEYPWVFDQNRPRNQASTDLAGLGIFLGDSTIATAHAGWEGTVHPFYVRMENPYTTTSAELEKKLAASGPEAFRKRLQELNGHDGIIITDRGHVVVFEPNQVKSATDNTGAFSNKNPDVRYSRSNLADVVGPDRAAAIEAIADGGYSAAAEQAYFKAMAKEGDDTVDVDDVALRTKAADWFRSLVPVVQRKTLGALTLRQLRDVFAGRLPQMEMFYQATRDQDVDAKKIMTKADEVYNKWAGLSKKAAKDMSELMIKATIGEVNPDMAQFEPRANSKALRQRIDANLARIAEINEELKGAGNVEKLNEEKVRLERSITRATEKIENEVRRFKAYQELAPMYRTLSKEAKAVYQDVKKLYTDNLESLYAALEERISRQVTDKKLRKETLDAIRLKYDRYLENGPYFPLSRFGEYLSVATKGGRREVRTFDTMAERARYMRRRRREGWEVQAKTKRDFTRETAGASSGFVEGIFEILDGTKGIPGPQMENLKDQINQHFIKALPDLSHRKHFVHREKVEGYSRDQMRAFADNMQHAAHHIARIRHADKLETAVQSILQESKMMGKDQEGDEITDLHNELNARLKILNNPEISPVTQALTAAGFVMNIGPSIASALVNMSQTPLVAFPILATRFKQTGAISAMNAITKATADYMSSKPRLESGPSLIDNKKLPQHERDMIQALIDDGTIDVTAAHSLAQAAGNDFFNMARTKHGHVAMRAMRLVSYPFHVAELANRKITALAAYRLALKNGFSQTDAITEARESVLEGHFDYCVDRETECLTADGWKKYSELVPGKSTVFAVDDQGQMVASDLVDLHVFNNGNHQVTEFSNSNGFSMVVTPNHTNLVQTYDSKKKAWGSIKKVKTADLRNHHYVVRTPHGFVSDGHEQEVYTDDEVRLITWIAADGWYSKYRNCTEKNDVRIGQSETSKSGNPQELRELLAKFGDTKEYTYDRTNKNCKDRFTTFVLPRNIGKIVKDAIPDKTLTFEFLMKLSHRQWALLLDLFLEIDGHQGKDGGRIIVQKNTINLECLQFIATAHGFSTSISQNGKYASLNVMSATKRSYVKEMARKEAVVDLVWCPETAHGTWIARRNGRVFVTGNSQANRARWMEGNVRRVLLLFKQYSQQMTWLLGRSFYHAAKGESPEVKAMARKRLGMILGGHFLLAGTQGMPVLGGIMAAVQFLFAAMGDDDEPKDLEVSLRNMLADTVGKEAGEALASGPWRMIPGLGDLDLSSRVSLGDLWFRAPEREAEGRDKWNQYVNLLLGPVATNASNIFIGAGTMADGQVWRGMEMMLPKFIKDAMKSVRYSSEGVKNWQEDTLIDNLSAMELFGQALGFTPSSISEMYAGANAIKNHESRVNKRRQVLVNRWVQATRNGNSTEAVSIMNDIVSFNQKQPLFGINGDTLRRAYQGRMRAQEQTKGGAYLPATKEGLRDMGRFVNSR